MFGNKVACAGVKTASEERAEDEVVERICGAGLNEDNVEGDLHDDVERVDSCERDLIYHHWAQRVEEDLESAEEGFAEDGVEEDGFESGGEVGI